MKTKLILTAAMIAVFFVVLWLMPQPPQPAPDPRVEQLQAEISQLRAEMEDVKSVQGYLAYEKDWRSKR
jgi:hypothetical protein